MSINALCLNFSPIRLTGNTRLSVGHRPYDEQTLRDYRSEFGDTHVFKRDRQDNVIVDIPVVEGATPLADKVVEIDLKEAHWFWAPLLNAALIRAFVGKRDITRDYPVEILGSVKRNYIANEDLPDWVQIRSLLQFTPRTIFNSERKPSFGLLCDTRLKNLLLADCGELLKLGISPIGRYVLMDMPPWDARLSKRPIMVGRVKQVDGEKLILDDHREGYESVLATEVRLSASRVDFDWCVSQLKSRGSDTLLRNARNKGGLDLHAGPGRLKVIKETLAFLRSQNLEAAPRIGFELGPLLAQKDNNFPKTELIKKPSLVFDPAGTRNDDWSERGIKANGPYDQRSFSPKNLNIAVICQARHEGQVESFVAKFLDGMPDVKTGSKGKERARYADGFLRRFQLEKPNVQTFTASTGTLESYQDACEKALQQAADSGFKWDLALVQIEESFKSLPGHQNPYYGTKALLLKNNVAVQNIRLETMLVADKNLVFTMNQISLATYAKLGGRPWLLSAQQTVGHELVIGVGSHTASSSRIGGGSRHVGFTTVFSSDGGYHISERTGAVPFDEYAQALTNTLKRTISTIRKQDNWKNTDRVRLIFHMFKPAKDVEADAIKSAVEALELSNVAFAFLHIAPSHPFVIFDQQQNGVGWGNVKKGILGPSRGVHLKLGDYESLVVFSGASELKQASDGLPRACLLKLHRNSTFKDMTYLARQAFDFTAHSWRIMAPEPYPITIKYSDLIAEKLTGLQQISSWDDDAIKFRDIGRTPWFL